MLGVFNTAMPFVLFAWAAQTLTASLLSVVNATAPILGAVIEHVWAGTPLSRRRVLGLVLGIAGVALLLGLDPSMLPPDLPWAVLAALLASWTMRLPASTPARHRHMRPWPMRVVV